MKKIFMIFIIIMTTVSAFAQSVDSILNELEKLKTYQADFIQQTEIEGFGEDTYTGKLYIQSGQKALWNYEKPYWQFYLFDAATMKYYDSETKQMIIQALSPATNAFMRLMLEPSKIRDDFEITADGNDLSLSSKEELGIPVIIFTVKNGLIESIKTKDQNGNNTKVFFENIVKNKAVDSKIFEPALPEGTEVFEYN